MLTRLRLERFKSFREAELALGPLTLLVGANASGKSNLRDAFRFLHGLGLHDLGRGYTLPEIIGEKWGAAGFLQWRGIRGGTREIAFQGAASFTVELTLTIEHDGREREARYRIEVAPGGEGAGPRLIAERLAVKGFSHAIFDTGAADQTDPNVVRALVYKMEPQPVDAQPTLEFARQQPILSQFSEHGKVPSELRNVARLVLKCLRNMRFLDLSPDAMRQPSIPGQTVLGDRGENLSSVLQSIAAEPQRKESLVEWVQALTPMEAVDFEFPVDSAGRVLVTLVEKDGRRTTANSASDGTLRFLAMLAALLGPEPARFYFFEEPDTGLHPTRMYLLLELFEQQAQRRSIQIVATTHSPQLLRLVNPTTLEYAALTYRREGQSATRIKRIVDIPEARRVVEEDDLARLHESGWLEDAIAFTEPAEATA